MVSMVGVGLGSFARESRAFGDQRIKRKLADLQAKQIEQQNQLKVRENINALVAAASGLAERAAETGRDVSAQIMPLRERIAATAQLGGINPQEALAMFDAATTGFLGPEERGAVKGREAAAERKVTGERETKTVQVRDAQGREVDILVDANTGEQIAELGRGPTVTTELTGEAAVTNVTEKELAEAKENLRGLSADLEEVETTVRKFEETPQAGGLVGTIIEKAGGVLQQLGLGGPLERAGLDPAEIKAVRSNARFTISRLLRSITQEGTARYTDTERAIAEQALATLDPTASTEQIAAAGQSVLEIMERALIREVDRIRTASKADITTEEGQESLVRALRANGFNEDAAVDAVARLLIRDAAR